MKRLIVFLQGIAVVVVVASFMFPVSATKNDCTTIQDGTLTYSEGHYLEGQSLKIGYDPFGFNHQAHMFNSYYANAFLGRDGFPPYKGDTETYLAENPLAEGTWYWPYRDVKLSMKCNDAWLSNKDCDGDGKRDKHYGFPSYFGSGAWQTNHQWGECTDEDDKTHEWDYFVKIVAVPVGAYEDGGIWYTAYGLEIGPVIWEGLLGPFAIILEVRNDPCQGVYGIQYLSPVGPGFGQY